MKKLAILWICIGISLVSASCASPTEKMRTDGYEAIEFINNKYQKEFKPITYEMADYLSDTDRIHCYTEGMDVKNEHVEIYVSKKAGKKYIFR